MYEEGGEDVSKVGYEDREDIFFYLAPFSTVLSISPSQDFIS